MQRHGGLVWVVGLLAVALLVGARAPATPDEFVEAAARDHLVEGRRTFRFDTVGSEAFWGDSLRLHQAIAGASLGGVGPGLSPRAALALGLKVDADVLPKRMAAALRRNEVNLDDPAVTLALLRSNAVIGVTGLFDGSGALVSVGIQCALCHAVVTDSVAPGIGRRLDGWANRDLNIGAIAALAPNLQPFVDLLKIVDPSIDDAAVLEVLTSWGPGKFDAGLLLDGKAVNPNTGTSSATLIPPAFGLADAVKFPIAAVTGFADVRVTPDRDRVTRKLAGLHLYQLALPPPPPPAGSFDAAGAARGEVLFTERAACARCHVPPLFTEPGWNMRTPAEVGIDSFQADRAPDGRYRTAPLRGLWTHQKGGFYHDGRFATLADVVGHYNAFLGLGLAPTDVSDLVEYLKSL